jgi:hypothetical protein
MSLPMSLCVCNHGAIIHINSAGVHANVLGMIYSVTACVNQKNGSDNLVKNL